MVRTLIEYQGEKHCEVVHVPSQQKLQTDAPKDNAGRGESFSPTDLVGVALGSCILTTMAIVAEREGIKFGLARAQVDKIMADQPRRIRRLEVRLELPAALSPSARQLLEPIAKTCPVARSLAPDIEVPVEITYV